jgi:hypothetical protein
MKLTIQVTLIHIANGRLGCGYTCPVARAMQEATGREWIVGTLHMRLVDRPEFVRTPESVRLRINRFDLLAQMRPFAFDVEVPDELLCEALS